MKSYSTMIAASIIFIISICEADIIQRLGGERACSVFSNNSKICSVNINGYSAPIGVIIPNGVENPSIIVLHIHGFQGVCGAHTQNPGALVSSFDMYPEDKMKTLNAVMIVPVSQY